MGPILFAFALAVALGVAYLTLVRVRGPELVPALLPPDSDPTGWGPTRPAGAASPAHIQVGRLEALLGFTGVLAAMAVATAGLTVIMLSLARAARRRRPLAIRAVLGATRGRLAGLLVREGVLLAGAGGLLGLAAGWAVGRRLLTSWPGGRIPGAEDPLRVLVPALAATLLGAAFFTLVPLVAAPGQGRLRAELSGGGRISEGRPRRFLRSTLVVAQLGVSVALLTGAGLLVRRAVPSTDAPGRAADGVVLTARLRPGGAGQDSLRRVAFYRELLRRAAGLTTVEAESIASPGAWVGLGVEETVVAECGVCYQGLMYKPLSAPRVREHAVSPGYFETLGIEVLEGRGFDSGDGPDAANVAVVSRSLARRPHTFQGGDPLGRRIQLGGLGGPWFKVVGVVEDVNPPGLGGARSPPPTVYVSAFQLPPREAGLAVRLRAGDDADAEPGLREAAAEAGGGTWALEEVAPLESVLDAYRAPVTWLGRLVLGAAGLALLLAVHGLFAVTAYHVRLRRREIGIRMALGAGERRILRLVLGENVRLLAAGALLGVWAGIGLGAALQDLGVPWFDPRVTGAVLLALLTAGAAGSWRPAREAASVEPAVTLSEE